MKKLISIFAIVAVLTIATLCVSSVCAEAEDAVSPGPAPGSGDGDPSGNQYIQLALRQLDFLPAGQCLEICFLRHYFKPGIKQASP